MKLQSSIALEGRQLIKCVELLLKRFQSIETKMETGGDDGKGNPTYLRFAEYLPEAKLAELRDIANAIVAPGKGILAADESVCKRAPLHCYFCY